MLEIVSSLFSGVIGSLLTAYVMWLIFKNQLRHDKRVIKTIKELIKNQETKMDMLYNNLRNLEEKISYLERASYRDRELEERRIALEEEKQRWNELTDIARGLWTYLTEG